MKPNTDLLKPGQPSAGKSHVQIDLDTRLAPEVRRLCDEWCAKPASVCRILIVEALKARQKAA